MNQNENKERNSYKKVSEDNNEEEEEDNSEEEEDDNDDEINQTKEILSISINNNNKIKGDYIYFKNSFKKLVNKAKEKQNKKNYIETEEAEKLLKTKKYLYLQNILSNKKLSNELFEKIRNKKINQKKSAKCRKITNEIIKRKDLDGLIIILLHIKKIRNKNISYKKKDLFLSEFKNSNYFNLDSNQNNNNNYIINKEMEQLKYMAENIMRYLKEKKDKLEKK